MANPFNELPISLSVLITNWSTKVFLYRCFIAGQIGTPKIKYDAIYFYIDNNERDVEIFNLDMYHKKMLSNSYDLSRYENKMLSNSNQKTGTVMRKTTKVRE